MPGFVSTISDTRTQMKPERAIDRYLTDKNPEWAESTYYNNASSLGLFLDFCEEIDLDNSCDIDGSHISEFKQHRREEGEVNRITVYIDLLCNDTSRPLCPPMGYWDASWKRQFPRLTVRDR